MRQVKDVLRLKFEAGLSHERIAGALHLSKGVVTKYLQRAAAAGLSWPLPAGVDEVALDALLFPGTPSPPTHAMPDYRVVHQELKRKSVTLQLLWEEYRDAHGSNAYHYSQFCERYRVFAASLKRSMRQVHHAGDKLFIDYSGQKVGVVEVDTGELRYAEIFVAVMGASSYAFAEATWTQQLPDWIGSHVRALEFFGGCTALLVPDNLRSAINKACRFEPEANASYAEMARHYGAAILPARGYKPRDKALAEHGVLLVQRWILARLRKRRFFSLVELNAAIATLLTDLNQRPFKKLDGCRASAFAAIDHPALRPLPDYRYEFAEWKTVAVNIDYHVEVDGHYYSVPHALVRQKVDARYTAHTIECFLKGRRVASHARSALRGKFTTLPEHMPESHRRHQEWTPGRLLKWAETIGLATRGVVQWQFDHRPHPEQGYRSCLGLLNLARKYGDVRLEAACNRALGMGAPTRKRVLSILEAKLDQHPDLFPSAEPCAAPKVHHANVRGAEYFRSTTQPGEPEPCSSNPSLMH